MTSEDTQHRFTAMPRASFDAGHGYAPHNDDRLEKLICQMPARWQRAIRWLRRPSARWARIPAGLLFIIGGCLAILPILGVWMIPLGLFLLAEDVPMLRRLRDRTLGWMERRWPHWFAAQPKRLSHKEGTK